MKGLLQRAFGIYPGQDKNILRFIVLGLLWAFGSSIAETLSIAIFVEKVGARQMPLAYMLVAVILIGSSVLFLYSLKKTTPDKIFSYILKLTTVAYAVFTLILFFHPGNWFWYLSHVATDCFVAALIASYWTFLDAYHDLQDAKRLYGVYNAVYFLGYVLSGGLINFVFDKVGIIPMFMLTSLLLFFAYLQMRAITNTIKPVEEDAMEGVLLSGKNGVLALFKSFIRSPYTILLVSMSFFVQMIFVTTEFSYMDTFSKIFNPLLSTVQNPITENTLPEFLGKIKAFNAISNIILGVFVYHRCIRRMGITNLILFPAIIFNGLYSEWLIQETLFIAVAAVVAIEGILFTIEDNNFNLLIKAAPVKLRSSLRFINDSVFEPIGMLIGSIFLIFFKNDHLWLGFILAIGFLAISLVIRSLYSQSVLQNLQINAFYFKRKISDWLTYLPPKEKKEMRQDIFKALKSNSEKNQLLALQTLLSVGEKKSLPELLLSANRFSEESKIAVIDYLDKTNFSDDNTIIENLEQWLTETSSDKLQKSIQFYFAKRGLLHPEKVVDFLDSKDLSSKAIAITTFRNSKALQPPETIALNKTIAKKEIDLLLNSENDDEKVLGLNLLSEKFADNICKAMKFLDHNTFSKKIASAAAQALTRFSSKTLSPYALKIIEQMSEVSDNKFRLYCLEALGIISDSSLLKKIIQASIFFRPSEKRLTETIIVKMGLKTVPGLISLIKNVKLHDRCRILASKILGRIALPQLQANLKETLEIEIKRAYFYLYFGHTVQKEYPLYDLKLLENALLTGFESAISFIIHLLGVAGSLEDSDLLVHSLRSKNDKIQADAVETLEKNCDRHIFNRIHFLIDDRPLEEKIKAYAKIYGPFSNLSLTELLTELEKSTSLFNRTVASHLKAKFRMPKWRESLREQIKNSDGPLHQYAYELLESSTTPS